MIGSDLELSVILPALLAGFLVLSIHVPLGIEVLQRGIIFIDLAIAQIAALGVIAATILGGDNLAGWMIQLCAAASALSGALLIHWLEDRFTHILEALIGLLFVLAASGGLILASYSPHSNELLRDLLVGQILWVTKTQLLWAVVLYIPLLIFWFGFNRSRRSMRFYVIFSLAVTTSVQLVGIYLVFASLILPALATRLLPDQKIRLITAWCIGLLGYLLGFVASSVFDLPTGAITVWALMLVSLITNTLIKNSGRTSRPR